MAKLQKEKAYLEHREKILETLNYTLELLAEQSGGAGLHSHSMCKRPKAAASQTRATSAAAVFIRIDVQSQCFQVLCDYLGNCCKT